MNPKPSFDPNIPVLTEVFQDQPARSDTVAPAPAAPAVASPGEPEWTQLEQRLAARIMEQLQGRIDSVLQAALAGLKDELSRSLQQVVADAVAQELAQLPSPPR